VRASCAEVEELTARLAVQSMPRCRIYKRSPRRLMRSDSLFLRRRAHGTRQKADEKVCAEGGFSLWREHRRASGGASR